MVDDRAGGLVGKPRNHSTLLRKYEIPIDHLSYEYLNVCSDIKELEKIVKILRSGEEGNYPHLESTAEERLRSLSPNNFLLRRAEPVLRMNDIAINERTSVLGDVLSWKEEISLRDLRLSEENNNNCATVSLPPIRQPLVVDDSEEKKQSENNNETLKVSKVSDYAAWDKYDADTELLKIELEEEREMFKKKKEKEEEIKRLDKLRIENERLNIIVQEADIQLKEYYLAADDANSVLSMDPNNVKAHYRRAVVLQHKGKYEEAQEDVNFVILKEPQNVRAKQLAEDLMKQMCDESKTLRQTTQAGLSKRIKIVDMSDICNPPEKNLAKGSAWIDLSQEPLYEQKNKEKRGAAWFPSAGSSTSKAKIIELPDEPDDHIVSRSSSKLEIVEVQKSENEVQYLNDCERKIEPSRKSKKCFVIDKRTIVTGANGDSCLTNPT